MNGLTENILLFSMPKNGKGKQENSIVKSGTNIFRLHCEPRSCFSRKSNQVQLIEYDNRICQEQKRYLRLLSELSETCWFTRHVASHGTFDQSEKYRLNDYAKYPADRAMNEDLSSDIEATRLTDDEILCGSNLTLDQVIPEKKKASILHIKDDINVPYHLSSQ